jgi:hypothetical protein
MAMIAGRLSGAGTSLAFMECLRDYHAHRGKPGSRLMAIRCRQACTATPIREALAADVLPNLKMLHAILDGLLAGPADYAAFVRAWHRLAGASLDAGLTGGRP